MIDGVYTPYPADGRIASPQNDNMTPLNCRVTSARSSSRVRTPGRPPSRVEVGVQVCTAKDKKCKNILVQNIIYITKLGVVYAG